jgi:hypothetical protein
MLNSKAIIVLVLVSGILASLVVRYKPSWIRNTSIIVVRVSSILNVKYKSCFGEVLLSKSFVLSG